MAKLKIRRNPTRHYEAVYIIDSAIEDAAILEKLDKLQSLLNLATPAEIEHWGRRQLAYKIGRHETGYYAIARFETTPAVLPEFERALKLDEGIIRYLISLAEHELGAPKLSDEELASRRRAGDDDDDAGTKPAKKVCASKPATIVLRGSHSSRVRLMFLMVASASHWTG